MNSIINHIRENLKTDKGKRQLLLEGILLFVGIVLLIENTPETITISGHVGLLMILYIMATLYIILKKIFNGK